MTYSMDATTADCYPGTTCLIKKLGIRDEMALAETEAAVVLGKASLLDQHPIIGSFDFDHYKRIFFTSEYSIIGMGLYSLDGIPCPLSGLVDLGIEVQGGAVRRGSSSVPCCRSPFRSL